MRYKIDYFQGVVKRDIPRLNSHKKRVKKAIHAKLSVAPVRFGKPLKHDLKGLRSMRVGSYRVVFMIEEDTVTIVCIDHRSKVYNETVGRLKKGGVTPMKRFLKMLEGHGSIKIDPIDPEFFDLED